MLSQKVGIRRQVPRLTFNVLSPKFRNENEATCDEFTLLVPLNLVFLTGVKSALPPRFARFNPDGIKDKNRSHWAGRAGDAARHRNWTFYEAVKVPLGRRGNRALKPSNVKV